ncbi:hypothetical protein N9064_00590 [bacterium]|nr:hypothetical protein [bacterium]
MTTKKRALCTEKEVYLESMDELSDFDKSWRAREKIWGEADQEQIGVDCFRKKKLGLNDG